MTTGTEPRKAALQILRAVRTGQHFDRALDSAVTGLSEADRRLAHEIAAGVLRDRARLDTRIQPALEKPKRRMPDDVRDVLRIGVFQLSHLDRVPSYAAVQSAVDLARSACGPTFAPLVNAVLRKIARAPETVPGGPDDLASRYSHPGWMVERWVTHFGAAETEQLLRHNNTRPPLVVQPARWTARQLAAAFKTAGVGCTPHPTGFGFSIAEARVRNLPGYTEGGFIVQDATQRRLLDFVSATVPRGAAVWDACAAPGGKAVVMARRYTVVASDRSRRRLGRLAENLRRTASSAQPMAADARTPPIRNATMDLVLIDAPCSATGTIARHPDARWRLSLDRIRALARRQAQLLAAVWCTVKPGGRLAYLTCSLEPEENQLQVDRFLEGRPDFEREGGDLLVVPSDDRADGGFAARLRRAT